MICYPEKFDDSLLKCVRHANVLSCAPKNEWEKKMSSLSCIRDYLSQFFSKGQIENEKKEEEKRLQNEKEYKDKEKKKKEDIQYEEDIIYEDEKYRQEMFCHFFKKYLIDPLNHCLYDECDECRNFVINIYMLIEQNLNDFFLDTILFKHIDRNEKSFFFHCLKRLKENETQKSAESKEEIRLCLLNFLNKIINRYIQNQQKHNYEDVLNFYVYLDDIILALTNLVKDQYSKIKIFVCQLLATINLDRNKKLHAEVCKELFNNLLKGLNDRQWKVRHAILNCLKILLCYDVNHIYLENILESLKKICNDKIKNVVIEILNCVKTWFLRITNLTNKEKTQLTYLILLCMSNTYIEHENKWYDDYLVEIFSANSSLLKIKEKTISHGSIYATSYHNYAPKNFDSYLLNAKETLDNRCTNEKTKQLYEGQDIIENTQNIPSVSHIHNINTSEKCKEEEEEEEEEQQQQQQQKEKEKEKENGKNNEWIYLNGIKDILPNFNKINRHVNKHFCEIKKELIYEIMKNEKNTWNEEKETFIYIIHLFLLFTYKDSFYFTKYIFSFIYKSLTMSEYIQFSSSSILIDQLRNLLKNKNNDFLTLLKSQYKSFAYFKKVLCLIIFWGYIVPIEITLTEIAKKLFTDSIANILNRFYNFCKIEDTINEISNEGVSTKHVGEETQFKQLSQKNVFLNDNFDVYMKRVYGSNESEQIINETKKYLQSEEDPNYSIEDIIGKKEENMKENMKENMNKEWSHDDDDKCFYLIDRKTYEQIKEWEEEEEKKNLEVIEEIGVHQRPIIYEIKSLSLTILSQVLIGQYIKIKKGNEKGNEKVKNINKDQEKGLNEKHIHFLLFLINEHINLECICNFPYLFTIIKYVIKLLKKKCQIYSKTLFHFLIFLRLNDLCETLGVEKIINKLEKISKMKSADFYREEFRYFIKSLEQINFEDFENFKNNMELLLLFFKNIGEEEIIENSKYIMNFLHMINTQELKALLKVEFLIVLYYMCENKKFLNFFLLFSNQILKNVLLPLCIWKTGLSEAKIRKTALLCLYKLLTYELFVQNFFSNNTNILEHFLSLLKSSVDDIWHSDNRNISISIIIIFAQNIKNNGILLDLLNTLLKLLDDSNNTIRVSTTKALLSLFKNKYLYVSEEQWEHLVTVLFLHMDDENQDIRKNISQILMDIKYLNESILRKHAMKYLECSLHAREIIQHLLE